MDFIFGKLVSDELKLTNHRAESNGIQHQHNISPLDPNPGESVTVRIVTASDPPIQRFTLIYTNDGTDPREIDSAAQTVDFVKVRTEWDTFVWDYITHWEAQIPALAEGSLVNYVISGWTAVGDRIYADYPDSDERAQHATMMFFQNLPTDSVYSPSP